MIMYYAKPSYIKEETKFIESNVTVVCVIVRVRVAKVFEIESY